MRRDFKIIRLSEEFGQASLWNRDHRELRRSLQIQALRSDGREVNRP
jgi:hypothetical protein